MIGFLNMSAPKNTDSQAIRDHGGGLDAAVLRYGGRRADWLDLSTGINPIPYPVPRFSAQDWTALPDQAAHRALISAAREFWSVPEAADILPAPGASALIARIPGLAASGRVRIETPTYNEHAAAFSEHGWSVTESAPADARVLVHPNNPDGRIWTTSDADAPLTVIDESFCDVCPDASLFECATQPGRVVLKSFGKFWGLAGLRLGFAIATPDTITQLAAMLGPWPVSGPALSLGAAALRDTNWAESTRDRLARDAARLDRVVLNRGADLVGGTDLFRLYEVDDAGAWQDRLARHHIWSRIFPYSERYLRLGLPPENGWDRLSEAL